jgi:hypothetical protein
LVPCETSVVLVACIRVSDVETVTLVVKTADLKGAKTSETAKSPGAHTLRIVTAPATPGICDTCAAVIIPLTTGIHANQDADRQKE